MTGEATLTTFQTCIAVRSNPLRREFVFCLLPLLFLFSWLGWFDVIGISTGKRADFGFFQNSVENTNFIEQANEPFADADFFCYETVFQRSVAAFLAIDV